MPNRLELIALPDIPLVHPGDDLPDLIAAGLERAGAELQDGDVLVIAQKIVSKSEDRYADLDDVEPSARAVELGEKTDKDPRLVELILSESREVLRYRPGVLIVAHRLGYVLANAGIDSSNVAPQNDGQRVLLLPVDPDGSCTRLRAAMKKRFGKNAAIVISDSVGRAWRVGTVGIALGAAGLESVLDLRGQSDLYGRPLAVSIVGLGDELAAAASILQGQGDEGLPVVLIRGLDRSTNQGNGSTLVRNEEEDLFR
ncbi:MAG: coenzyme F420-0:L-glutamate ligase [Rhodospirillaceae bacterium]|jgi:coenzyme F420-0:L-glutamate ligase / coenzyme F420-1:gamma-L-glutamate ligase|nr:coenzyme F420-0:L-glutamate ligase [Rhodospirillaceae bacterium]MBT3928374.1 coenzyme F420-0:L-glutamate ligase [Rhodospirillaceae bacterium]MBT4428690.1 coenzyme F420-0:L-glutamate ligase [Rhodospirillaceae bacterium]MBT6828031.1 coenzyme F420-0:L-glutamate ligase [Rhodospirillaceae bacterium]